MWSKEVCSRLRDSKGGRIDLNRKRDLPVFREPLSVARSEAGR